MMGKNYRQALADARKCLELGGKEASVHVKIVQCCVVLGLAEEGRTALQQLPENHPQARGLAEKLAHIESHFNQAVVFADDKKYREAESAIDRYRNIIILKLFRFFYGYRYRIVGFCQRLIISFWDGPIAVCSLPVFF
jgi:hypothetical protein